MECIQISWKELEELASEIAENVKASPIEPKFLYAVDQQSLVPAMLISRKLEIPITDNCKNSYTLFVSAVVREGKSLISAVDKANCFVTCSFVLKDGASFEPDFVGKKIGMGDWAVFPWSNEDEKFKENVNSENFSNIIHKIKGD